MCFAFRVTASRRLPAFHDLNGLNCQASCNPSNRPGSPSPGWANIVPETNDTTSVKFGPVAAGALLTLTFVLAFPVFGYFAFRVHGWDGVAAAAVAALICWVAGVIALAMVFVFPEPQQVANAVGLGMLVRMGIALLAGIFFTKTGGPLVDAGVFGMIVGFYLIGLLVETLLALRLAATLKAKPLSKAL